MPFASLGEGVEATLYAAVTEEILTELSRFKDLAVLGGKSAQSLPPTADSQSIAREMAARYLMTGSLRRSGPEIHVSGRLVDARRARPYGRRPTRRIWEMSRLERFIRRLQA